MKQFHPKEEMGVLCGLFGKSRQGWYQQNKAVYQKLAEQHIVLEAVRKYRKLMPRLGTRKLQVKIKQDGIRISRDQLFDLLRQNGLLVRRRRSQVFTTQSSHWLRKYSNLIRQMEPTAANQLWVSDITYVRTSGEFLYLFLITDAYSHKIVGYQVAGDLSASNAVKALKMALRPIRKQAFNLIHHSDRGIQYCCKDYVKILKRNAIGISMTENGDPLENAIAERVNGILKDEWLYEIKPMEAVRTKQYIAEIIRVYNHQRPHLSIDMLTPVQAHQLTGPIKRKWKNYYPNKN